METILEAYSLRPVAVSAVRGFSSIPVKSAVISNEIIGIEVEVENANNLPDNLNKIWTLVEDGSLRNSGAEFITKPIHASAAPVVLEYLMNHYLPKECCFSPRTSVHIHLNVQEMTRAQVQDMILLYAVYEHLFYKFVGKGRQKNIYCVPLFDCNLLVRMLEFGERRNWSKYTGLNTLPLGKFGTLEFRHMHGTTNVEKLSQWISLICRLKEYVARTPSAAIRTAIVAMNDQFDFANLLGEIFGDLVGLLKYDGPTNLHYLQAKQAITTTTATRALQQSFSNKSAFYQFKA